MKNYEEIKNKLKEMIIDFEIHKKDYERDVYLYVDDDSIGTLFLFENVGGRSYLNDDHYTIYSDKPSYHGDILDFYEDFDSVASVLDIEISDLIENAKKFFGFDSEDELDDYDFLKFIENNEEYMKLLNEFYIDEELSFAAEKAAEECLYSYYECCGEKEEWPEDLIWHF